MARSSLPRVISASLPLALARSVSVLLCLGAEVCGGDGKETRNGAGRIPDARLQPWRLRSDCAEGEPGRSFPRNASRFARLALYKYEQRVINISRTFFSAGKTGTVENGASGLCIRSRVLERCSPRKIGEEAFREFRVPSDFSMF